MAKDAETIRRELAQPFAPEDLEWRIQQANKDKTRGMAVAYVTNRAIQDRLDDVVGPENWHNDYKPWHSSGKKESQICGISIYNEERKDWNTKWDGAEDTDIESIKGGLSDSMKRAAVQWGIGRYLYKMEGVWVNVEARGNSCIILSEERTKLDKAYMERLKKMPFISVNPKNPARQKVTAAARLYKEYVTSYMNALRILLNVLRKVETSAQDELLKRLGEFM